MFLAMKCVNCAVVFIFLVVHKVPTVSSQNSLTCLYLGSDNSTCANEGDMVECICMNGGGITSFTLWNGTAFVCPNDQPSANNQITVSHAQAFTTTTARCGNTQASGFNVSGDTYTSLLTVNTTLALNNRTVECSISGALDLQTHTLAVGASPVQVNEEPSVTFLNSGLQIESSSVVPNELTLVLVASPFPAQSTSCGMFQQNGVSPWAATNIPVAGQTCNFSVVTENICGFRSEPSPSTCVLIQVPQSPLFNITHRTYFNNSLFSVQVDITSEVDDNSPCLQDNNIDYTFSLQQGGGDTCEILNTESCGDSTCRMVNVSCTGSSNVTLSAIAVNKFGSSNSSNDTLISYSNDQFSVMAVVTDDNRVLIHCVIDSCTSSATCDVVYGSERRRASEMTSDCSTSSSRNITLELLDLPMNQKYYYNVTVTIDGTFLSVTGRGSFQIGVVDETGGGGGGGASGAIIGGVVGGIIVLVLVIIVIVSVVMIVIMKSKKSKPDSTGDVEDNIDAKADLATYADPNSIEHQQAPSGEEYALVDRGARNKPEASGAVYQDPHTIQHQEAAGGDLYTVVDKPKKSSKKSKEPSEDPLAQMYSVPDKSRKNQDKLTYADIDLPRGGAIPTQHQTEYSSLVN